MKKSSYRADEATAKLNVQVPYKLHRACKLAALQAGMPMCEFVARALEFAEHAHDGGESQGLGL